MFSPVGSGSAPSFNSVEESQPNNNTFNLEYAEELRRDRDIILAAVRMPVFKPVYSDLAEQYEETVKRFEWERNTIPLGALKG